MIFLVVHGFLMFFGRIHSKALPFNREGLEHGASLALGIIITHSPHLEIVLLNDLQSNVWGAVSMQIESSVCLSLAALEFSWSKFTGYIWLKQPAKPDLCTVEAIEKGF